MPPPSNNPGQTKGVVDEFLKQIAEVGRSLHRLAADFRAPMQVLENGLANIRNQVVSFVSATDPSAVKRFDLAARDLSGVIGKALVPVLENFTAIVREIGDGIASLTPQGKVMVSAVVAAGVAMTAAAVGATALSAAINSATAGIPALLGAVAGGLTGLGLALKDTAGVSSVVGGVMRIFRSIVDTVGEAVTRAVAQLEPLFSIFEQAAPVLNVVVGVMGNLVSAAMTPLVAVAQTLAPIVTMLAMDLGNYAKMLGSVLAPALQASGMAMEILLAPIRLLATLAAAAQSVLQPALDELLSAFGQIGSLMSDISRTVSTILSAAIAEIVDVAMPVIKSVMEVVGGVIRKLAQWLRDLVDYVRDFFGIEKRERLGPDKSSDGASIRNVNFGSVTSFLEQGYKNAFMAGPKEQKKNPMDEAAENVKQMRAKIEAGMNQVEEAARETKQWLTDRIVDFEIMKQILLTLPNRLREQAKDSAAETGRALGGSTGAILARGLMSRITG